MGRHDGILFVPCLGLLALASGCVSPYRTRALLSAQEGLIVSNSPMQVEAPPPEAREGVLTADYALLVQNSGGRRVAVELTEATFSLKGRPGTADCRVGDRAFPLLRIAAGERYRIDCRLRLEGDALKVLSQGDADGILVVPIRFDDERMELSLGYRFQAKDAP